jgi:hypothetical protein
MPMSRSLAAAFAGALLVSSAAPAGAAGMHAYTIVDPVLSMPAWSLALPAGWTAQGTMLPGSSCSGATTPVYKATGPAGLGAYFLPRVDWAWGPGARAGGDCMPWSSALSAKQFMAYQIGVEHVQKIADEPVPPPSAPVYGTLDQARALVRYTVGARPYEALLETTVTCQNGGVAALGEMHLCSGLVRKWYGPAGSVLPNLATFESLRLSLHQDWMARWTAAMRDRSSTLSRQQTQALLRQGDLAQATRMRQHQQYMASAEQSYAAHNDQFGRDQYRKQSNNDNFVDYVLDCQRFYNNDRTFRVSGTNCPNRQTF